MFTKMNITDKIIELEKELTDAIAQEQTFHDKAILLRRKIGKLRTVLKDTEEILGDESEVKTEKE
jgi:hypothetical protein